MTEPIKKGDLCLIVKGFNEDSPNVGKIVTVGKTVIEHPLFGRMVEISGAELIIENRPTSNTCNIPVAWLKKIEPPKLNDKTKTKELENA